MEGTSHVASKEQPKEKDVGFTTYLIKGPVWSISLSGRVKVQAG